MNSPNWTRNELILALNLYMKLPFGKLDKRTPEVKQLAVLIGRTDNAVSMRLNNYVSVDPFQQKRGIKGLINGREVVKPIWDEFDENREVLLFESEKILAELEHQTIETKYAEELIGTEHLIGEDKVREVKTRVNQQVFRQIVTTNYGGKCAITGINIPELLIASHIIPWAKNEQERLNPENGICLSATFDKAFDKGFIGINERLEVIVSSKLKAYENETFYPKQFADLAGKNLLPSLTHPPRKEFLQYHLDTIFQH
ncbi:MAG: HNH endonuclease [Saprospiraceae bacterium]|nr:HNH endonuclease [Saprospiraceae bacterium]MCF8252499.1 HNH endonuclease [Saprospiraceae bacterium]MCF8282523.1 HNH endonuclease [Bacteroidales bacterium]MCF8314112.1 HNH endonuclease [Saprospiraceae bacterium]MCF8442853.1 HNH endonuclease [Saprospiraceae bacterium]